MKKFNKFLFFTVAVLFFLTGYQAFSITLNGITLNGITLNGTVNYCSGPHDSLLFDGENSSAIKRWDNSSACYWKVVKVKGFAYGTKRKLEIGKICGVPDTVEILTNDSLREGDILGDGTLIETGKDGQIAIAVFLKSSPNSLGRMFITTQPSTLIKVPMLSSICDALVTEREIENMSKVLIIKGKITMDSKPGEKVKNGSEGKRSTVKHKKTRYSHEVLISGSDTTDIIRVYEGAVEIQHKRDDFSDEEAQAEQMQKLSEDFQAGKITIEEMTRKIEEYTKNAGKVGESMKPFTVDEGFKCILSKKSYTIEPLGAGDEDEGN